MRLVDAFIQSDLQVGKLLFNTSSGLSKYIQGV